MYLYVYRHLPGKILNTTLIGCTGEPKLIFEFSTFFTFKIYDPEFIPWAVVSMYEYVPLCNVDYKK
jgi:hypothetical protein